MEAAGGVKKSNTKLNALLAIEKEMQEKWAAERIYESDAPENPQ